LVIIADEPTNNLGSKSTEIVMEIFENLNKEKRAIIMVVYEIDLAKELKES
jgi:ABC-type lipoprotein export system ATPase subunit